MNTPSQIIVMGALGRMGQMILKASVKNSDLKVIGAVERIGAPGVGQTTGIEGLNLLVVDDLAKVLVKGAIVIDFTTPEATLIHAKAVEKAGAGIVIGTTGLSEQDKKTLLKISETCPVLLSPNMSLGVNICFKISELVASVLKEKFDVEIIEAHHNLKKDAPSGTALGLAEAVARGHEVNLQEKANFGREGMVGERPLGEIGIHAVRGGDIAGDHTVLFAGDGERIEIKHMAHSRQPFANGALRASQFLAGKTSGFYTMADALGLS